MTNSELSQWRFWIDRGGTFTDIVAKTPSGQLITHKLLSENPAQYADAALAGIRKIMNLSQDEPVPQEQIREVKMGTTVATNALLERKGSDTVLCITAGFADALRIGYQARPHLFQRHIVLPEVLYKDVIEINERVLADGSVLKALDLHHSKTQLLQAFAQGYRSVAIVLMHAYQFQKHEQQLAQLAQDIGFTQISVSHEVSALMKLIGRGDTTVADAYLSPVLRHYVNQVSNQLQHVPLLFMQSNGGLTAADRFQGKDAILSGPAGGIVGMVRVAQAMNADQLIGFDMGGTSTDVSHYDGSYERVFETVVAGVRLRAPMMNINTVAAGGGSIVYFDGQRMRVGPESAGANPGPCAYRNGGPLTVTDCNVMLGKLQAQFFPSIFGPNADQDLDVVTVQKQFQQLAVQIQNQTGQATTASQIAEGFIQIAVVNMAHAIKKISIERGYDVTRYSLVSFGGAGGQHACLVADALGIQQVLIHPFAGVLSAYGMGLADVTAMREATIERQLHQDNEVAWTKKLEELTRAAHQEVVKQGIHAEQTEVFWRLHLRYEGTDSALIVNHGAIETMQSQFNQAYLQRYRFLMADKPVIVEAVSVEVVGHSGEQVSASVASTTFVAAPEPIALVDVFTNQKNWKTPIYNREALTPGVCIVGPAIVFDRTGTTMIEPEWELRVLSQKELVLHRNIAKENQVAIGTQVDPVMLEIFNNLFMSIAEQMGATLANTAFSVNIKERLDFSCALFDIEGNLIANAPHMPVHLGSMGASIQSIIASNTGAVSPGDVYMLNDPYHGGTHLPDITVVTPVFNESNTQVLFYVASRGHHADVGGISPGSMPPNSRSVIEEGVLINNFKLVEGGRLQEQALRHLLLSGPYPVRNVEQNIADLRAQIAANEKGVSELHRMVQQFGLDVVQAYMQHVQDNAQESVRRAIDALKDGAFCYEMDDGAQIQVAVKVDKKTRSATVDFTGTSAQVESNFNAPKSVCMAAVLYVFRTLVNNDIPMNQGCLIPIEVIIPEGSMLNPRYPAATVAGNVETSQAITDAIYGALGVMAASQSTMNNLTFGNDQYQYYETIAGGSGAGQIHIAEDKPRLFAGTDVVQTHMTNSRLTDPEILEWRYPVVLEQFSIRKGSGGAGVVRGGDGAQRRIRFLTAMQAAILANRRRVPPFGLEGGHAGLCGENRVIRADGSIEVLASSASAELQAGDAIEILTPGGGGFGVPIND